MATNNFLPFAPTDTGTNLLTQGEYAIATDRTNGNQPGTASSKLVNKAIRQSSMVTSQIAQYLTDRTGLNAIDDATAAANLLTLMNAGFAANQSFDITNLSLAASVGSNALTIAVKTKAASADPSATDFITAGFRSATIGSGAYLSRTITAALSMVISSGSTLGQTSGQPSSIFVYLIDNAGSLELAVSHSYYPEDALVTTTAEGGAGAADSATAIYSTTARSNVAIRLVGVLTNTQATAGTWATNPSQIQLAPFYGAKVPTIQKFTSGSGTYNTPAGVSFIKVTMVGGGGGGGGGGTAGSNGGVGGNTTFGSALLVANGGNGGFGANGASNAGNGNSGGTTSLGSAVGTGITGATGFGGAYNGSSSSSIGIGGPGGNSFFGGAGAASPGGQNAGGSATANTGSGGQGGGSNPSSGVSTGGGGGSGGFVEAIITTPLSSYAYAVGAAGSTGAAGTNGAAGGSGGSGYIEVTEYYY